MRLGGGYKPSRQLAIGKTVYVKVLRGQLIVCKWPRKRRRVTHATTLEQMERFRQANWLAKYAPAPIQMAHRRMVEGTSLLPRDLMVAAMLGRGMTWQHPGERRRYPVAALRDLSETLDIFGAKPSDVLGRGADRWQAITPTQPGQALVSGAPDQAPTWQTLSGSGGLWQQIEDVTLVAPLALNVYRQVTIPANAQELEWTLYIPAVATGFFAAARINNIASAAYFYAYTGISSAGGFVGGSLGAQTSFRLFADATQSAGFQITARGRLFAANTSGVAGWWSECNHGSRRLTHLTGQWQPPAPQLISQLGFAGTLVQGLPAGTRIIVRATVQ